MSVLLLLHAAMLHHVPQLPPPPRLPVRIRIVFLVFLPLIADGMEVLVREGSGILVQHLEFGIGQTVLQIRMFALPLPLLSPVQIREQAEAIIMLVSQAFVLLIGFTLATTQTQVVKLRAQPAVMKILLPLAF